MEKDANTGAPQGPGWEPGATARLRCDSASIDLPESLCFWLTGTRQGRLPRDAFVRLLDTQSAARFQRAVSWCAQQTNLDVAPFSRVLSLRGSDGRLRHFNATFTRDVAGGDRMLVELSDITELMAGTSLETAAVGRSMLHVLGPAVAHELGNIITLLQPVVESAGELDSFLTGMGDSALKRLLVVSDVLACCSRDADRGTEQGDLVAAANFGAALARQTFDVDVGVIVSGGMETLPCAAPQGYLDAALYLLVKAAARVSGGAHQVMVDVFRDGQTGRRDAVAGVRILQGGGCVTVGNLVAEAQSGGSSHNYRLGIEHALQIAGKFGGYGRIDEAGQGEITVLWPISGEVSPSGRTLVCCGSRAVRDGIGAMAATAWRSERCALLDEALHAATMQGAQLLVAEVNDDWNDAARLHRLRWLAANRGCQVIALVTTPGQQRFVELELGAGTHALFWPEDMTKLAGYMHQMIVESGNGQ